jgi:hypothetical protein
MSLLSSGLKSKLCKKLGEEGGNLTALWLSLVSDSEDERNMFPRNIVVSPNSTALKPRRL